MASTDEQGTGKHKHKSAEEPFPHTDGNSKGESSGKESSSSKGASSKSSQGAQASDGGGKSDGGSKSGGSAKGGGEESSDLKSREYTGPDGEIHHHTKKYAEQHSGK